jgi:hypothetical protein
MEKSKTLSKEKIKKYLIHSIEREKWIKFTDIKGLNPEQIEGFKNIIKEMIDDHDYENQKIWIEFSIDYESFKIFDYSGFKNSYNEKSKSTIR